MTNWPSDAEMAERTTKEVAEELGISPQRVRQHRAERGIRMTSDTVQRAYRERDSRPSIARDAPPVVEFDEELPDPTTEEAFNELWEAVAQVKAVEKRYDPRRHKIGVKLPGNKPVGFVFSSDWQLGSEGVDYELWREDMALMREVAAADPESLYGIGLGDYQSALSTLNIRGSAHRDVIRAGDQYRLVKGLMHLMPKFWLVLLTGCHDTFTTRAGDIDPVEEYCRISGARHGWHGVEFTVSLGKQSYVMRLRHRYRFNSSLNPLNSQRRQTEMEGPADVVAHAHQHTSLTGESTAVGQDTVMLRSGSYQIHDDFARQVVGNVKADPRFPMVIVWPDKHTLWSCRDFKDGLDFLASLRNRA